MVAIIINSAEKMSAVDDAQKWNKNIVFDYYGTVLFHYDII